MMGDWSILVSLLVVLIVNVNYTENQLIQSPPVGVFPPSSFGTAGGGGSLLPFPLFPSPCEVGYMTCEGPAGYIITNINIPGPPAIPATNPPRSTTPVTSPRPTTTVTTARPTTPTTARPPATTPRPMATTARPLTPAQIPAISQQIVYMYPQWCNMWCRLMQRPQPVFRPQPCLLFNWIGMGGAGFF